MIDQQIEITDEQRQIFERDGVVHIPNAVSEDRVEQIRSIADQVLASPSHFAGDTLNDDDRTTPGRNFTDRYLWRHNDDVRDFVVNSGVAAIAGQLLDTDSVRFYFDHLLVKEPGTPDPTPWHQDIGYWPFLGRQIASVWVSASDLTTADSNLEFIRGSHHWGKYFTPKAFTTASVWAEDNDGDTLPNIDNHRDDYDIISHDVNAGDAVVFSAWIVHGAPGNAGPNR
ncbi:MAG: phytanoyl-CoA dioxygenase family protein, partial [Acidimicrobiia bacterium]|nr:phytanoyl-CoA dioxygenase family protein [Acidimicrobiia bacterium]